jgi:hypothetical protein
MAPNVVLDAAASAERYPSTESVENAAKQRLLTSIASSGRCHG